MVLSRVNGDGGWGMGQWVSGIGAAGVLDIGGVTSKIGVSLCY